MLLLAAYLAFQTSAVQTFIVRHITTELSKTLNTEVSVKRVNISFFSKVILKGVYIGDQQQDTLLYIDDLVANIDALKFKKKTIDLSSVSLLGTKFRLSTNEEHLPNYSFLLDHLRKTSAKKDSGSWEITCRNFLFDRAQVGYSYFRQHDKNLIDLRNIHLEISDFALDKDSIYFRINHLNLDDNKLLKLENLNAEFTSRKRLIKLTNLRVKTNQSQITKADFTFDQRALEKGDDFANSQIDLNLEAATINLADLGNFIPQLKSYQQELKLSGHVFGKITELRGRNLHFSTGRSTAINCNFYLNGLPDLAQTFIQLDLQNSAIDFRDISGILSTNQLIAQSPRLAAIFNDAGLIRYHGNFTGFLSDFVAYGSIRSDFGRIDTDLSFKPDENKHQQVNIAGHLRTYNFNLGKFTQSPQIGRFTFAGQVDGNYNSRRNAFNAAVKGRIDSIAIRDYSYRKINLDGLIQEQKFEGQVSIDDPNLNCLFSGKIDNDPGKPAYDFELMLNKADLVALKLDKSHQKSDLSLHVNANFSGKNIDEIKGTINVNDGSYSSGQDTILLNSLAVETSSGDQNSLKLKSDFLDVDIEGSYRFNLLPQSLQNLLHFYLPSSGASWRQTAANNIFKVDAEIKNVEPLMRVFSPKLQITSGYVTGSIDESQNKIDLYSEIAAIQYADLSLKGYSLSVRSGEQLEIKSRAEELNYADKQKLYNLALLATANDDQMKAKFVWNNYDILTYSGEVESDVYFSRKEDGTSHIDLKIAPSKIYIADTLWQIRPAAIAIDSSRIEVDNLMLSHKNQFISFNGVISNNEEDQIDMRINQFKLENLNLLTGDKNKLKGMLDGTISFIDLYKRPLFLSDIKLKDFNYNNTPAGNISMLSKWDRPSQSIQSELIVDNDTRQTLYGYGSYFPINDSLDFTINADALSLSLLNTVMGSSFENIHGSASGELKIKGGLDKIEMYGDMMGINAGLALKHLQVSYYFTNLVKFRGDSMIFDNIEIQDFEGHTGIFNGSIRHDNFSNMDYNLSIRSNDLLVMNTTPQINPRFYGKAYASGLVKITGHGARVFIDGTARTLSQTAINIALDYEEEAQEYDFIRFVSHKAEEEKAVFIRQRPDESAVNMNFNLNLTPDAHFQLVYNSSIGDVIRAQGTGNMQLKIDPDFNIELYGDYLVDRGDYLFTLKNVINKKFEIERGGKIQWNGDPYDANIDVNAIYRLKASLNELFVNSTETVDYTQRVPVVCRISLKDNLNSPDISFGIEFPSAEDRIKEEVKQFMSTDEDMNKQILSLLVMGRFYTPEYLRGSYEAQNPNLVGTTASELFSNQLSNWLSQISNDFDIGVNYRPGNQITDDEIELALSTQFFNDRVTVNGNISNNTNQTGTTTTNSNSSFIGDFDVNVKLTNNGKLQLKAYNHSNNNIIYETSPYKQGIGLSYRENYDSFEELWQKFLKLFRRKK
ncbi:translocation/assembly module TamB domain-containing protein [Mangrovibacterium marinum]|uniref:translocation/assembly module TamB domain-containing protein n=1 Tax=Mangrovibacterium marinum TaxID=1639118 RepID=UPI002A1877EB|nr:translocation/assembly module TamB domain-containing protein [Mangrovibacterium marinum]